jgi:hypothetical protein
MEPACLLAPATADEGDPAHASVQEDGKVGVAPLHPLCLL